MPSVEERRALAQLRQAEERIKLRQSPRLRFVALQFWLTMGLEIDGLMSKKDYMFVHRRITKALAPEMEDEEAEEIAESDWAGDLDLTESGEMNFDKYAQGIFEIADNWIGHTLPTLPARGGSPCDCERDSRVPLSRGGPPCALCPCRVLLTVYSICCSFRIEQRA